MMQISLLAVAVATGRVGIVYIKEGQLLDFEVSRQAVKSADATAMFLQKWIKQQAPSIVVTEKLTERSKHGSRSTELTKLLSIIASYHTVHDLAVVMDRQGRTRFEQAAHLAQIYPDIAPRLPRKCHFYESEDRAMILFDALTLAHTILESSPLRLVKQMDTPTDG